MLMILIRSRLQGRELKPVNCAQVQDHLRFIDLSSERYAYARFLFVRKFYMNRTYAYLRNDRKIKFRMVSAQHFINEAPASQAGSSLQNTPYQQCWIFQQGSSLAGQCC